MNNVKFAKAYAAYTSGWLGKSIYHAWFMFFADLILEQNGDRIDLTGLRDAFLKKYGVRVPLDFIKKTLQMCGSECISSDRKMYAVADKMKLQTLVSPDKGWQDHWARLKDDFQGFCLKEGFSCPEEMDDLILSCIEQYDVEVVSTTTSDIMAVSGESGYVWNKYVKSLHDLKPGLYEFVCCMCYGSIAKDAMLRTDGTNLVFKGLTIYLDTPLVFQLLGISETEECESADYLIGSLRGAGCAIKVFNHTIEEVERISRSGKRWALDLYGYDARRASKTARYFREHRLSSQQIDELICNIDGDLSSRYGVTIDNATYEHVNYKYQVDVKRLKEMFDVRYSDVDPCRIADIEHSIDSDIRSISMLYHRRGRDMPRNFNQCRVLMLTSSKTMACVSKEFQRELGGRVAVPVCLSSKIVASMLWAASPKNLVEYKKLEMIADCARFLKPTDSALKKFFGKFSTVDGSDKEMQKKYFTLTVSPIMEDVLMDVVKGDENAITDNTIDEVYERIRRADMDVGMRILKNEREKDKMEKAALRHDKFRRMARPVCCIIWITAWTVIVMMSASISYCLHCWVEDKSWVGYVVLFVGDVIVLGGDIHEQWIRRIAARISCLIVRRIIRFFLK